MVKKIGFIILSHSNPSQLLRLVRTLLKAYDEPSIVCHHDFGQCPFSPDDFPSSVQFVSPHVPTRWMQFSIVAASLAALELLYRNATPDWFFLLSGTDYPTMRSETVIQELASNEADALLDYREVRIAPAH